MAFNDTEHVFYKHPSVIKLHEHLKLEHFSGYISLINPYKDTQSSDNPDFTDWILFDVRFGIPLFDRTLNKRILALFQANKLGRASNLRRMLDANRALALRLIDFIQAHQTVSVLDERANSSGVHHDDEYLIRRHNASLSPLKKNTVASGMVIYPTQCVMFLDGHTSVHLNEYN